MRKVPPSLEQLPDALKEAIEKGTVIQVKSHVRRGAPLTGPFVLGHAGAEGNAVDFALYHKRTHIALELLRLSDERKEREAVAKSTTHAVIWSARDCHLTVLQQLLERGADVAQKDARGATALQTATLRGHGDAAKMLLKFGAWDVEPDQDTVRKWAAHWKLADSFAAAGCAVGKPTAIKPVEGPSPSTLDAQDRHPEHIAPVEALPAHLALDSVGRKRIHENLRRDLMQAIRDDDPVQIEALVKRGAPLFCHYYSGHNEPRTAGQPRYPWTPRKAAYWTSKGPDSGLINPVDWATLEHRPRAALQLLLIQHKTLVFSRDENQSFLEQLDLARTSKRAVNAAAFRGWTELLQKLLELGGDVAQKNPKGESALFVAVREGQQEAAAMLLKHGAWSLEERKCDVLQSAIARRVTSVLQAAGVAVGSDGVNPQVPAEMVKILTGANTEDEKKFLIERMLEKGRKEAPSVAEPNAIGLQDVQTTVQLASEHRSLFGDLREAVRRGDVGRIHAAIKRGSPIDEELDLGHGERGNILDWAVVWKKPSAAMALVDGAVERGVAQSLVSSAKAALHWAVMRGELAVLEKILPFASDLGRRSLWSGSALALGVFCSRSDEISALLAAGAWEAEPQKDEVLYWARQRRLVNVFEKAKIAVPEDLPPAAPVTGPGAVYLKTFTVVSLAAQSAEGVWDVHGRLAADIGHAINASDPKVISELVKRGAPIPRQYLTQKWGTGTAVDEALHGPLPKLLEAIKHKQQ